MNKLLNGFIIILSLACSKAEEKPEPEPATPDVVALHNEAMARLQPMLDMNYVVSRGPGNSVEHRGDSLLWTSLLVASSTCAESRDSEMTLQRSMLIGNGQLRRHYEIDDASADGAIGLFRAVAKRHRLGCTQGWLEPLQALKDYADANHGRINDNSSAGLDLFDYTLRAILDRLTGGSSPDFDSGARDLVTDAMANWALGIQTSYALYKAGVTPEPPAAYRVHLALLTLETLEDLGITVSAAARNKFCQATEAMDMPTTDHWCGRTPIAEWIATFEYNVWEFRHQRAGRWETPDGQGYQTPAIDLLYGIAQGYIL